MPQVLCLLKMGAIIQSSQTTLGKFQPGYEVLCMSLVSLLETSPGDCLLRLKHLEGEGGCHLEHGTRTQDSLPGNPSLSSWCLSSGGTK